MSKTAAAFAYSIRPAVSVEDAPRAILTAKDLFQRHLAEALNLRSVPSPLFVEAGSGINDDLNGLERPVSFSAKGLNGRRLEVVQSLAKWKRLMLARFGTPPGEGILTDMRAIRPDEDLDSVHSLYVDQWDWERAIHEGERNLTFLKAIVRRIYGAVLRTESALHARYPEIGLLLPKEISFVHSEELEQRYPLLDPAEREDRAAEEVGAVFIIGIGASLRSGRPHDGRAPDYDDWITPNGKGLGLNGDLVVWFPALGRSLELSSMGIRVDPASLVEQVRIRGCEERLHLPYHRKLRMGDLPPSVGGGIGQSRLCMFLLRKAHIGEVQVGVWPESERRRCRDCGIHLL
jgi:aspartate--ammonia ligase